jgi:hypothetical protein
MQQGTRLNPEHCMPYRVMRRCPAARDVLIPFRSRVFAVILLLALLPSPLLPGMSVVPDSRVSAWNQGDRLMDAGNILQGIRLLDSLRRSGFDDPNFLSDYSRSVFRALVPPLADSSVTFLPGLHFAATADSALPDRVSWKVTADARYPFPVFQYGAAFTQRKPFKLFFGGLAPGNAARGLLAEPESAQWSRAEAAFQSELGDRIDAVDCTVWMDLNDAKSSLTEYIGRRINGVYDSIGTANDLARYRAVSIRCFRHSFTYGREGEFAAFVVFDRTLKDLLVARNIRSADRSYSKKKIRFTVAVRAGMDIQDFAESKLQTILKAF